jgi:DNA-binding NtrC family response regulator
MLNKTLLIVEDEPLLASTMEVMFKSITLNVLIAQNGRDALEVLSRNSVDVIISDINMPIMNGLEFIKAIRAKDIKSAFIFYTGYGNSELLNEAAKYGAYDFLNKPYFDDLLESVTRALKADLDPQPNLETLNKEYMDLLDQIYKK